MKKYLLLLLLAIFTISCSKRVDVTGKIKGGSPLERIEFIEASGVASLPLINVGVDKDGNFKGSFNAPKDGMYVITYAGKQGLIYLRRGEKAQIVGDARVFPTTFTTTGKTKSDNDFVKATQDFLANYASKLDFNQMIVKDESTFITQLKKIEADLKKNIEDEAKKKEAGSSVVKWKRNDLKVSLYGMLSQYELMHGQAVGNPSFKVGKAFKDYKATFNDNNDELVKEMPMYRNLLLNELSADFQKYFEKNAAANTTQTESEIFAKFLQTKSDLSQVTKDYLLAYLISQSDIVPGKTPAEQKKILKLIDENIKDSEVKNNLKQLQVVISGPAQNEAAPQPALKTVDKKSFDWKAINGKPTLVMFYASWNPYISEAMIPVVKEVVDFYKSKVNFVYVNVDDTHEQFVKTSNSLLKGLVGHKVYAENGLESDMAKKYGIYGFKLPSFIIIGKDGKVASRFFYNLGELEFVETMDKLSGLKAPTVNPNISLQNDLLQQAPAQEATNENSAK